MITPLAVLDLSVALHVLLLLVRPSPRLVLLVLMRRLLLLLRLSRQVLWLMLRRMLAVRGLCQRRWVPVMRVRVCLGVRVLSPLRLRLRRLRLAPMPR